MAEHGETIADTRRRTAQRSADIEGGVNKATGQNQPTEKRVHPDKTTKIPTSSVVDAAKATERTGSSGERQFGAPLAQDNPVSKRDNTVRPEQQSTDNENSSNP